MYICTLSLASECNVSGGSVSIISTARDDWTPLENPATKNKEDPKLSVKIKGQKDDDNILDACQPSQADWIKRYVECESEVIFLSLFLKSTVMIFARS